MKLQARGRQRQRQQTISVEQAPQTFDPYNTNQCPAVLDDKWRVEEARR